MSTSDLAMLLVTENKNTYKQVSL